MRIVIIVFLILFLPIHACAGNETVELAAANRAYDSNDFKAAMTLARKVAEGGNVEAKNFVGHMYYTGKGVIQDYIVAEKWWRKAAEQGYPKSQRNLGMLYNHRTDGKQNAIEAVKWYRKSAEQGYPQGQFDLGAMYSSGSGGLPKDINEAEILWIKAAEQGDARAKDALRNMYEREGTR